ncbi:hypothetical protein KC906_04830, partial [Candidatus Kaiserbacteria bacterium]|nr:hypothetical protein [Candidatus Kaiserbacteria bacterium]
MSFIDPSRTPESFKVGVDSYLANAVKKGSDGRLYSPLLNPRTKKLEYKSPQDISDLTIAFPGSMKTSANRVAGMRNGKLGFFRRDEIDYEVPHFENSFSSLGSMVPMKSAVKAQRMAMASRMLTQALPIENAESPLVRTGIPDADDDSYEHRFGKKMGAVFADQAGRVMDVSPTGIKVKYADGTTQTHELYENFPFNRKTFVHNTPTVKPGDTVQAGAILAKSNFTDAKGTTALGKNARVAYLPFRGLNFEDAIVISESFAKRMSSEHMYQHGLDVSDEHKVGLKNFVSLFPGKYDRKTLATMDDDGVIKVGAEVRFDEPLILAAKQRELGKHKVHRKREAAYNDATIKWNHHATGVVTDVYKGPKGTTVLVKAMSPMQVGDKMSGRYGDKGVLADIIPDREMPTDEGGQPAEVLLNPLGIISRTNPAQM